MSLSLDDVQRIALLARIAISDTEAEEVQGQLNRILGLIELLQAVNIEGVEPMSHPQDVSQRLRPDQVSESDRHIAFQQIAPQVEGGLYLVPKVIE